MKTQHDETRLEILHNRIERATRRIAELQRTEGRYPWLRLAALVIGFAGTYTAFSLLPVGPAWAAAIFFLAVFVLVSAAHHRVLNAIERYTNIRRLAEDRLARIRLDWASITPPLEIEVPAEHPFDRDLIVTGPRSLHQLLDTAASLDGSRRLAQWLLSPIPDPALIQRRQTLVHELLSRWGLRARLALDGALVNQARPTPPTQPSQRWDAGAVLHWLAQNTPAERLKPALVILFLLAAANITLFILNALGLLPPLFIATFILYFGIQAAKFRESAETFNEAYNLALSLGQFRAILQDLETYPFAQQGGPLAELTAPFWQGSERPSRALRQIGRIATAASLRNNPFLALLLNILIPWDLFFAYQLERFKRKVRGLLPVWLDVWYELEALSSLAEYASLNPACTFPEIMADGAEPVFSARALGHPLIDPAARKTNDFSIQKQGDVILITGSNMSGKSTFLRTVGANLCLAYAGSAVPAASLRALPFRLYTSMNLADSLSDGISYFYAEVRRLKALLDTTTDGHPNPVLYLIDEIFRGTNNRERRLGSEAYVRALAGKDSPNGKAPNCAGLISTHDLELVRLADEIPQVNNYHFREDVQDGRMVFDYRLRRGASPTTNALRIMAIAGLPVPEKAPEPPGAAAGQAR